MAIQNASCHGISGNIEAMQLIREWREKPISFNLPFEGDQAADFVDRNHHN